METRSAVAGGRAGLRRSTGSSGSPRARSGSPSRTTRLAASRPAPMEYQAAQVKGLVREGVGGPAGLELAVPAIVAVETREVDLAEMSKRLAGFRREIGVIGRPARLVELNATGLAVCVDEARQEARAAHADLPAGEVARDRGQMILLAQAVLATRETDRCESADDEQDCCNEPHRRRIGIGPDVLDFSRRRRRRRP